MERPTRAPAGRRPWAAALLLTAACGSSLPPGDAARGAERFTDTTLGTNGKSCATCHPGGGRPSLAGSRAMEHTLRDCIQAGLQGDPGQDQAVADLQAYVRSLAE